LYIIADRACNYYFLKENKKTGITLKPAISGYIYVKSFFGLENYHDSEDEHAKIPLLCY